MVHPCTVKQKALLASLRIAEDCHQVGSPEPTDKQASQCTEQRDGYSQLETPAARAAELIYFFEFEEHL